MFYINYTPIKINLKIIKAVKITQDYLKNLSVATNLGGKGRKKKREEEKM